jgi:putative peptide zinc metalloprotease protein
MTMRRRFLTTITAWIATFAIATAPVQADTTAIAINTTDNSTLIAIVFDIERILGKTVDTGNAAAAVASCKACTTVAIAFQIVLAAESPNVVIPQNLALALNVNCSTCKTFAAAFQYVYAGGEAQLTHRGLREIMRIRDAVLALQTSGLPPEEIIARAEALNRELVMVLSTELVPADQQGDNQTDAGDLPGTSRSGTTPSDTGTSMTPTQTDTTPTDTGTQTTPTETTPTDTTPTQTTPSGSTGPTGPTSPPPG